MYNRLVILHHRVDDVPLFLVEMDMRPHYFSELNRIYDPCTIVSLTHLATTFLLLVLALLPGLVVFVPVPFFLFVFFSDG